MTPQHEAALNYLARGWRPVPILAGAKKPPIDNWTQVIPDVDLINDWYRAWPNSGVGIVTGPASGFFVLDVDVAGNKRGDDTLADLEHQHGALPPTVEAITGSGGRHIYFRVPDGVTIINSAGNVLGPGLDIRGDGGQVVAPPSIHKNGQPYQWEVTSHPDDIAIADAPDWLIRLLTASPDGEKRRHRRPALLDEDAPGNKFAAAVTWPELLEADGAVYLGQRIERTTNEPYELWSRPANPGEHDWQPHTSATLYYKGSDVLKVFSSSWWGVDPDTGEKWQLVEGDTYTRFGYFTARYFNNDFSAAAGELARRQSADDIRDWLNEATHTAPTEPDETASDGGGDWLDPLPLGAAGGSLPTFPVDALPEWIAAHCHSVSRRVQVAVDLPAMLALGALSIAATGRQRINVNGSWTEHLNLYLAVALPPGEGKSPSESATIGPLRRLEVKLVEQAQPDITRAHTLKKLAEKRLKTAEDKYARSGDTYDQQAAVDAALDAAALEVPPAPRLITGDATPEALTRLIAQHHRMAVVSTEGGVFDLMVGRYSDNSNLDVYLQAWSGDAITVDRIGRDTETIAQALLTIAVTVQPHVIRKLAERPELAGRGLTARFMYAIPKALVGSRDAHTQVVDTPDMAGEEVYAERIGELADRWLHTENHTTLTFTDEARAVIADWWQSIEDRMRLDADLHPMAEWVTKLRSSVIRVCGLLHLADGSTSSTVEADVVRRAVRIGEYWIVHAKAAHALWDVKPAAEQAQRLLDWLTENELTEFASRDAYRALHRTFPTILDMQPALELLIDYGWLKPLFNGRLELGRRGKQSPRFAVHPLVTTGATGAFSRSEEDETRLTTGAFSGERTIAPVVSKRDFKTPSPSLSPQEHTDHGETVEAPQTAVRTVTTRIPSAAELLNQLEDRS